MTDRRRDGLLARGVNGGALAANSGALAANSGAPDGRAAPGVPGGPTHWMALHGVVGSDVLTDAAG